MNNSTISIIIPCYNEENIIQKNFECILSQSILPEEVIFVDNNSTDSSLRVAESYKDKFSKKGIEFNILIEKDQSQKQVIPRMIAFEKAKGELVGMIDVDTQISKDWVKTAKRCFAENKNLCSLMGPFDFWGIDIFSRIGIYIFFVLYYFTKYFYLMWGCNGVLKKEVYNRCSGLNDYWEMHQDLKLAYIYDDNFLSEKLKLFGDVKFCWQLKAKGEARNQDSSSNNRKIDQLLSFFKIKNYVFKKYKNKLK